MSFPIEKIKHGQALCFIFAILTMTLSPYWFLFEFAKKLFESHDTVTMLLLSISIGFPTVILNTSLVGARAEGADYDMPFEGYVFMGCLFTMIVFYVPCFFTLAFNIPKIVGVIMTIPAELLVLFLITVFVDSQKKLDAPKPSN